MALLQQDFFIYEVDFAGLAVGVPTPNALQIDASADFKWLYSTYTADIAGALQTSGTRVYPLVNMLITPTDTNSQFMNAAVPVTNFFGTAENPFIMPVPRVLRANSSIAFQANSFAVAGTIYNLRLSLIGIKQYVG